MPASEAREGFRQAQGLACLNGINESQEDVNGRLAASTTFHPFTTPIYSFIYPVTGFLRWLVTISKKKKKKTHNRPIMRQARVPSAAVNPEALILLFTFWLCCSPPWILLTLSHSFCWSRLCAQWDELRLIPEGSEPLVPMFSLSG